MAPAAHLILLRLNSFAVRFAQRAVGPDVVLVPTFDLSLRVIERNMCWFKLRRIAGALPRPREPVFCPGLPSLGSRTDSLSGIEHAAGVFSSLLEDNPFASSLPP